MSAPGSVTQCLRQMENGDKGAFGKLWDDYFCRLVGLARARLQNTPRRAADEEDVALSALVSFCQGVERGRFPRLLDRDGLWRLLVVITVRKAIDLHNRERRRMPRHGTVLDEAALANRLSADGPELGIERVLSREPTPELAARVAEEFQRLLRLLGDDERRTIALMLLEDYRQEEIAAKLGCVPRTVRRKLKIIRGLLRKEGAL